MILKSNTILYCKNWQETLSFYRNILGFPINLEKEWFVELAVTETSFLSIANEKRASIKSSGGGGITLAFQVEDVDQVRKRVCDAGIQAGPVKDHEWGARLFYMQDPEGHRVEIWTAGEAC